MVGEDLEELIEGKGTGNRDKWAKGGMKGREYIEDDTAETF